MTDSSPPATSRPEVSRPIVSRKGLDFSNLIVRERPVPPTPASRRLRVLIAVTALAVVLVEVVNLRYATDAGFNLFVRSFWALLRIIGFLLLMRAVRFGRLVARPFGLILAATTIFAVARLAEPRTGRLLPATPVLVSFGVLTVLCGLMVWQLYRSDAVAEHLNGRQVRRHVPGWVITVRVAALAYSALLLLPFVVSVGAAFTDRRLPLPATLIVLVSWFVLIIMVGYLAPLGTLFVLRGKTWARWLIGLLSVFVLVVQPALCYTLLGWDGLLRDGAPMVITALLGLLALHRSRGLPTWYDPATSPAPAS